MLLKRIPKEEINLRTKKELLAFNLFSTEIDKCIYYSLLSSSIFGYETFVLVFEKTTIIISFISV